MNDWTDRNSPRVLQDFSPFRAAALKRERRITHTIEKRKGTVGGEMVEKCLRSRRHKMTEFRFTRYQRKGLGHRNNN